MGRLQDYGPTLDYFWQSPFFGRGFSTFIPTIYRTLDNQYLGTLVEIGIIGILGMLVLFFGSMLTGFRIRARSSDPSTRSLAISLIAAVAVVTITFFTYDGFGFPMGTETLFLVVGAIGALDRLSGDKAKRTSLEAWRRGHARARRQVRRWTAAAVGVVVIGVLIAAWAYDRPPQYTSQETYLMSARGATRGRTSRPVRTPMWPPVSSGACSMTRAPDGEELRLLAVSSGTDSPSGPAAWRWVLTSWGADRRSRSASPSRLRTGPRQSCSRPRSCCSRRSPTCRQTPGCGKVCGCGWCRSLADLRPSPYRATASGLSWRWRRWSDWH